MSTPLIQDLTALQQLAITNEQENDEFLHYIKQQDGQLIDPLVHSLNKEVSAAIDCTACGNCCRTLMINVEPGEPEIVAGHLEISVETLKERYIEESQQGKMIVNTIPCHFLADNQCTIYEHRFNECREFPHLHKPGFIQRLPGTLMHYGRCPIIYHVIESLKIVTNFNDGSNC